MRRTGAVALLVVASSACLPSSASARDADTAVRAEDLSFRVTNVNRSKLPCQSDGADYLLAARLLRPASPTPRRRSLTVLVHGAVLAERALWRLPGLPRHNTARALAARGHTVLSIDRLGYGASSVPHGFTLCAGGQADALDQVLDALAAGRYERDNGRPIAFRRFALLGFSLGGLVSEVATSSFDDVDALAILGWADSGLSTESQAALAGSAGPTCALGGEPKRSGAAAGYVFGFGEAESELLFADARPRVIDAARRFRERDNCGEVSALAQGPTNDRLAAISVPVLLMFGEHDAMFPASARAQQLERFSGTPDLRYVEFPRAGHTVMLERSAPRFRATVSRWLRRRGF